MWDTQYITSLAAVFGSIAAIVAAISSLVNRKAIQEVHLSINSRMDQLVATSEAKAHLEGAAQARSDDKALLNSAQQRDKM